MSKLRLFLKKSEYLQNPHQVQKRLSPENLKNSNIPFRIVKLTRPTGQHHHELVPDEQENGREEEEGGG